jgi:outer membrane lipoprotein-sorting protein
MKKLILLVAVALLWAAPILAQAPQADLQKVLALLDKTSASFKSVQSNFTWDQYQSVVEEHDIQSGDVYFRRSGANTEVAADIQQPDHKKLLYTGGAVKLYSYKTRETTTQDAAKHRQEVEDFLALGFGGSGRDLAAHFDLRYLGAENLDGRDTYKLELTPKSPQVKNMFKLITLWIDQQTGMSLQQKALQGASDYRLAKYPFASMKINQPLPGDAFKLKD